MKFYLFNNGEYLYFRSMFGGNPIIGRGDYGIVLKPDIIHGNDNYISKLFILPEYITIQEFEQFETKLNTIDLENRYHVPFIDIVRINETHNLNELDNIDEERYVHSHDSEQYAYIATYEYGGLSINNIIMKTEYNLIITPLFCREILNGFLNLLDGIIYFSDNYIHHRDIHAGNIVILLNRPSVMRFIDFNCKTIFTARNYIRDIIDILQVLERMINKFIEIFIEQDIGLLYNYFQSILKIVDKSKKQLVLNEDIKLISEIKIISEIKQTLKKEFDEIELLI